MNKVKIPYGRQSVTKSDIDSVVSVLKSDYITQGPVVPEFEKKVGQYVDSNYVVATNSATSALHIACLALGMESGDWLWTSPNSFVASSNCALYCGGKVDFIDINPETYNICPKALKHKLEVADKEGLLPKIVVPVHYAGQSSNMKEIHNLSKRYGFKIIEDASHAIGGKYQESWVGSCLYSDIAIFSFHPVKIITCGEGGMALTNNSETYELLQSYRSHGVTSNTSDMKNRPNKEIWNYQQINLGLNYRMTEICAALGHSQMNRLSDFISRRHKIANRYNEELIDFPVITPFQHNESYSSYHLYPIRLKLGEINLTQKEVYKYFHHNNIMVNIHYIPIYRHPYYEKIGFSKGYCPEAELYYQETISLPIYPDLTEAQQSKVINTLLEIINR